MTKESDKDIVDTLYSSYELILKIKDQFIAFDEFRPQMHDSTAHLALGPKATKQETEKADEAAQAQLAAYEEHLPSAADLLQEMENIRTYKILSGEAYLLGAIMPLKPKK